MGCKLSKQAESVLQSAQECFMMEWAAFASWSPMPAPSSPEQQGSLTKLSNQSRLTPWAARECNAVPKLIVMGVILC